LEDVAQVAAKVLTEDGHRGAIYELVGAAAMTQMEIAKVLSERLNRPVMVKVVPLDEWERNARANGMGEYQTKTLLKMFRYYERYGFAGNPNILRFLLQRQPASFVDFVERIASERKSDLRVG
jgi:nucleoside-diphosphate-sugar epimerase